MLLASLSRRGAPADDQRTTKPGYAADGNRRVEPGYEATKVRLVKGLP